MENVGEQIGKLPIEGLKTIEHLVYYDGPILSHSIDINGKNYMVYWVDRSNLLNRWMIFHVSEKSLLCFLEKKTTLGELLNKVSLVFLVDIDDSYNKIFIANVNDLPDSYLPEKDYYYELDVSEKYDYLLEKFGKKLISVSDVFTLIKEKYENSTLVAYTNTILMKGDIFQFQD